MQRLLISPEWMAEVAEIISKNFGIHYKTKAKELGIPFLNASDYIVSSLIDGIHWEELTNNKIESKELKRESADIFSFLSKYGKAAAMEVATVYDLSLEDSEKLLKDMTLKGLITETKAGNGFFYSLPQKALECDVLTGKCL